MVLANATISYGTHYTPTIQEEIVESSRVQLLSSGAEQDNFRWTPAEINKNKQKVMMEQRRKK